MEMERNDGSNGKSTGHAQEQRDVSARLKCSIEEEAFCCDACTKPLRPPIFQCLEGHFICSLCRDKLPEEKCKFISGCSGTLVRSLGMEHAVQSILVDCDYTEHGCTEKTAYYCSGMHRKICRYGRKCPEPDCKFARRAVELLDHLITHHKWLLTTFQYWVPFDLRVVEPGKHVLHCKDDDQLLLVTVQPAAEPPGLAVSLGCVEHDNPVGCSVSFSCSPRHTSTSTVEVWPWWHFGWPLKEYICVVPKVSDETDDAGIMLTMKVICVNAADEDGLDDSNYVEGDEDDSSSSVEGDKDDNSSSVESDKDDTNVLGMICCLRHDLLTSTIHTSVIYTLNPWGVVDNAVCGLAMESNGGSGNTGEGNGETLARRVKGSIAAEDFSCGVCHQPLRPPIFQCSLGSFICSSCRDKLPDNKCSFCSECALGRSLGMERAIRSILVDCCYAEYGCADKIAYCDKGEHEKSCRHAPCLCPETGCGFATAQPAELLDHFTGHHKWPSTTFQYWWPFDLRVVEPGVHVLHSEYDGQLFLLSDWPPGPSECICVLPNHPDGPANAEVVLTMHIVCADDSGDEDDDFLDDSSYTESDEDEGDNDTPWRERTTATPTLTLKLAADAQEQGESSAKRPKCCIEEEAFSAEGIKCCIEEKAFCCDVCSEPLRPPIFECVEGHFFCSSCRDKLPKVPEPEWKKCTLSSGCGGSLARSLGMEHAVQSILVDCDYAELGCTDKMAYGYHNDRRRRSQRCPYRGRKCPEPGCGFAGRTAAELLDHLTAHHKWPSTTFQCGVPFDLRVVGPGAHVLHCKDDGQLILVSVQPAAEPPGLGVSLGWVEYVADPDGGMFVVCSVSFSCSPRHRSTSTVNLWPWWYFGWPPTEYVCVVPKVSDEPAAGPDGDGAGVVLTMVIGGDVRLEAGSDVASEEDGQDDISYVGTWERC
ncbi:hypothetical protein U9M48_020582 [Paspalum notatum var. saurae]|uniref:RING-type E3 ubiquitin transferase n=1 Tax=Paspalum notatum var. saurae TaxID=547442 RepID=A0AAQ3WSV0_PASNO